MIRMSASVLVRILTTIYLF